MYNNIRFRNLRGRGRIQGNPKGGMTWLFDELLVGEKKVNFQWEIDAHKGNWKGRQQQS